MSLPSSRSTSENVENQVQDKRKEYIALVRADPASQNSMILVLGTPGSGKSSFINTCAAATYAKYYQVADVGEFDPGFRSHVDSRKLEYIHLFEQVQRIDGEFLCFSFSNVFFLYKIGFLFFLNALWDYCICPWRRGINKTLMRCLKAPKGCVIVTAKRKGCRAIRFRLSETLPACVTRMMQKPVLCSRRCSTIYYRMDSRRNNSTSLLGNVAWVQLQR